MDMKTRVFALIAIGILGAIVGLSLVVLEYSNDAEKTLFSARFHFPERFDNISITRFELQLDPRNNKKKNRYIVKDEDDLKALYNRMCHPQTPFLNANIPGRIVYLKYDCTFSDNATSHYHASLKFSKDGTYLRTFFQEDDSFMGDPSIYIQLEGVLREKTLRELRDEFLDPSRAKSRSARIEDELTKRSMTE